MAYNTAAWTDAAWAVYTALLTATSHTDGKNAFMDINPGVADAFFFAVGGGDDVRSLMADTVPVDLHMDAVIHGQFTTQAKARAFGMAVLKVLPMVNKTPNMKLFRPKRLPDVTMDLVDMPNRKDKLMLWICSFECEIVFTTDYVSP